jgi:hypothetical protein
MTDSSTSPQRQNQGFRFFPAVLFFFLIILLFIGGTAAVLYLLFSEYSGVRNLWLLVCRALPAGRCRECAFEREEPSVASPRARAVCKVRVSGGH